MIPYAYLGRKTCGRCNKLFEFDVRLVKRTPSVCADCKQAGEATRQARIKTQKAQTDCVALERLAIRTHAEVGVLMGLSAEMVRKLELRALDKIRKRFGWLKAELLD